MNAISPNSLKSAQVIVLVICSILNAHLFVNVLFLQHRLGLTKSTAFLFPRNTCTIVTCQFKLTYLLTIRDRGLG